MKIIFVSYYACCQNPSGGVQSRLRKIASLMKERGLEVELYNPFETRICKGDILHIFMLTLDTYSLINIAKSKGAKVVISTIVPLIGENKLKIYRFLEKFPIVTTFKFNKWSLQSADALITESQDETDFLVRNYGINRDKFIVIPNGIDEPSVCTEEIYEKIGKKCKYVLQVGRIDENKNQLNVIRALKGTSIDVVFAGGPTNDDDRYYRECVKEAEGCNNIHFLGWIDNKSSLLQSAYCHADILVLPSHYETFGMVALEGGIYGAKLAFSKTLPIRRYEAFNNARLFEPNSVKEIRETIKDLYVREKDSLQIKKIRKEFDWSVIIDKHLELYNNI